MRSRPIPIAILASARAALVAGVLSCLLAAAPAAAQSPWELLDTLRDELQAAGPMTAPFTQTYIPAGFSEGDRESGQLAMWLPDCLRWSYEKPDAKHFLVCQGEVHYWNEGDSGGRRYQVRAEDEPGLDLLLLSVDALRERYVASSEKTADGGWKIRLEMPPGRGGYHAEIRLDPSGKRIDGLEYTDAEGNLTRFTLGKATVLNHTALFKPPSDFRWTTE